MDRLTPKITANEIVSVTNVSLIFGKYAVNCVDCEVRPQFQQKT